jgi:hypothetical protein
VRRGAGDDDEADDEPAAPPPIASRAPAAFDVPPIGTIRACAVAAPGSGPARSGSCVAFACALGALGAQARRRRRR